MLKNNLGDEMNLGRGFLTNKTLFYKTNGMEITKSEKTKVDNLFIMKRTVIRIGSPRWIASDF